MSTGTDWHSISSDETLAALQSRYTGLEPDETSERLSRYGPNELMGRRRAPPVFVFLKQFLSPLIYVLLLASLVSLLLGHISDAGVILGVLLLNATIGAIQELRAEKAMEALIRLAAPHARVKRNGQVQLVPAAQVTPGDILLIETGDRVAADARLLEIFNLRADEASLTGESMPVDKQGEILPSETPLPDRKNMVYMGAMVTYGRATAVVTATGMATEIGRIAAAIEQVKPGKTPLQKSIARLSRYILFAVLAVLVLMVTTGLVRGLDWLEVFLIAVAAAVSAIPEGLPIVVTVVLAIGMRIMAHRNSIVRRLVAVETLGSTTVICSDKTGTLTMNEMTVRNVYIDGRWIEVTGKGYEPKGDFISAGRKLDPSREDALSRLLMISALCNDALLTRKDGDWDVFGDPTEGALLVLAVKAGLEREKLEKDRPRLDEIPFRSEKQYMATFHPGEGGRKAYVKGSVEKVLSLSRFVLKVSQAAPLRESDTRAIDEANLAMAQTGMRVIAFACADLPAKSKGSLEEQISGNLVFVGMAAMADPPREEAKIAIRDCATAGIKVMMITGDHKATAESIGRELGLPPGEAVTGTDLAGMDDAELTTRVERITIFARIEPLDKLRIIKALKNRGHVVAMTGDGVNDAPALKAADIGIAMGITGTDVAKGAADMILADDNFASVVAAVEEGRAIFTRLRNVIFFLLSTNFAELLALILCILLVGKAPMLAVQILWVNLATDTSSEIPLGLEPKSGDELKQPPRHPNVGLVFPGLLFRIIFQATLMSLAVFLVFRWALPQMSLEKARTLAFSTMVAIEWLKVFNARSDERTVFQLGLWRNRWLLASISAAVVLQLLVVYVPILQIAFDTVPLSLPDWAIVIAVTGILFGTEEARKALWPRLFSQGKWRPWKASEARIG